ncbi:hypothetical protein LINGRAHAP2_LOCUS4798 [Linum grandiflorum]
MLQSHKDCAKMNRVHFPCYDGLEYVFGKVRATGTKAVGPRKLDVPCPKIEVTKTMLLGWSNPSDGDQPQADGHRVLDEDYINFDEVVPPPTPR